MADNLIVKFIFQFVLYTILPGAAFYGGYVLTEHFFRWKLIPYPSEHAAIAVGLGFFFWTLAVVALILGKMSKRRTY